MGSIEEEPPTEQKSIPFNLTDIDRQVLSQTDEEFVFHDWEDLEGIIGKFILTHCSPHRISPTFERQLYP